MTLVRAARYGFAFLCMLVASLFNLSADVISYDFSSTPAGTRIIDRNGAARPNPRIEDGVLKLTDANDPGENAGFAIGPFPQTTISGMVATWRSRLGGGGGGGADGYAFSIGADLSDTFGQGEEGTGTGLIVAVDTFDNGVALDPAGTGLEIKWGGTVVASTHINKDNAGDGIFLRKDTFVDAAVSVSSSGAVTFTYDGIQIKATIPSFAGIPASQYMFTARTGGANDNQWIDDLRIVADTAATPIVVAVGGEWAYHESSTGPVGLGPAGTGSGWELNNYDTNSVPGWKTGIQLFGNDGTGIYDTPTQPFGGLGVAGFSTPLDRSNGRVTFYFRKKFNWTGPTVGVSLISSNWVDDGLAAYINGQEIGRIRVPDAPAVLNWDTLGSNPATEGVVEVRNWGAPGLVEGENTLAVELHQSSTGSSDVAFAMDLRAKSPVPPTIVDATQPTNRVVFAARATTLIADAIASPVASYQWYRNGQPIDPGVNPTATAANYVISVMAESDAGDYFCRIVNVVGTVDTRTATIGYLLDVTPPKVVSVSAAPTMDGCTVVFDELVDFTTATSTFGYEVTPQGGSALGILAAKLNPGGRTVTLTTDTPLLENTVYTVRVTEVQDLSLNTILDNGVDNVGQFTSLALGRGFLAFEIFTGLSTSDNAIDNTLLLSPKFPNAPDGRFLASAFNTRTVLPTDSLEGYGGRVFGAFVPPASGNWIFYIRSDDSSRLYLNAGGTAAAGKVLIQEETGCCGAFSGHASPPQALTAGQAYYIEAIYKEGGGGDYVQVAAKLESDPTNPDALPPIGGHMLGFFGSPVGATASITQNPASATVEENHGVTFTAAGTASFVGSSNRVSFIWQRSSDGGATFQDAFAQVSTTGQSTFTIPFVTQADSGSQVRVLIQAPGASAASAAATLTVTADGTPPQVVSVSGSEFMNQIRVVYNELMESASSAETFSYTVTGPGGTLTLNSGALQSDGKTAVLTLDPSSLLAPDTDYTIRVDGPTDLAGVPIAAVTVPFRSFSFSRGFLHLWVYDGLPTGDNNIQTTLVDNPKFPNSPDSRLFMPSFETRTVFPTDAKEGYGGKIAGLFVPPSSGNWIFYIVSDDSSRLYLNPLGTDPNGKVMIQEETGCCGTFEGHTSPPQALTAGSPYYIEAIYKEGTGGDYCRVAAKLETDLTPPNSLTPIPGSRVGLFADPTGAIINITQQPNDITFVIDPLGGSGGGGGSTLLSENFNSGDGGFSRNDTGAPNPPAFSGRFAYDAASGSWQVNAVDDEISPGSYTSRLRSPTLTVGRTGLARLTMAHRWSVEPDFWDGTQLRISVNGGAFVAVPASAFSQGGYGGTVRAGNSVITGQQGWVLNSAGHETGAFITSVADLGFLNAGDTLQVEFLYAGDTNTKGPLLPSWQIDSVSISQGIQVSVLQVAANASRPGTANQTIFYQWQRNTGSGWVDIVGANGTQLLLNPLLTDNGNRYRVELNIPGKQTLTREATLTVVQPNTPPQFTCGPGQTALEDGGAQLVSGWATDIQAHSIPRNVTAFASAFDSMPAGTRLLDNAGDGVTPRVEDGVLKLSNAENLGVGGFGGWAIGPFPAQTFESIQASFKSLVGGGGNGGADGYSFNIGDSLADNFQAEEGTGDDLIVTVDTFDNGTGADVGVDIKWRGARIAYGNMPKDDDGSGLYVRKNTFVDVTFSVSPSGLASLNYDGVAISGQIPDYAGVRVNQVNFAAREGGANDRHWVDDLDLKGFPFDASSVEAGQTVQFIVSNDNPSLFVVQPAVSPNGTLSYAPAPNACGVANVTIVAKDSGGTAFGGQDTSAPCVIAINIQPVNDAPVAVNQNLTGGCTALPIVLSGLDPDIGGSCGANALAFSVLSGPSHGSLSGTPPNLTYLATAGYVGPDSFTFQVSDGPASATGTISITVPSCNTPPTAKITAHGLVDFTPDIVNGVLISGNGSNACLTLDGLLSTDLETPNQLTYDWTLVPSPVPFASGVLIGTCLDIGTHTIMLTVTDPSNAIGTDSISIDVLSAAEAIEEIIDDINESTIARGNKRPFIASLKAAAASTDRGNAHTAQNQLKAFQNKLRAQVAKDNPAEAARWTRLSQAVIDALEGQ